MASNPYSIPNPKVDPARRPAMRPDNTPDDNDRIEIGPTPLAYAEWEAAGLQCPDLPVMRQYRLDRIVAGLVERDLDAVLLFDPLSIRYATDTTHMQLWNAHNPFRACMVTADGHMVLWEYGGYAYLSEYNPLVREVRFGASFFYFATGQRTEEKAELFAGQIVDLLQERVGSGRRVAVDKIQIAGLRALDAAGVEVMDGEELMERVRAIKGPDEILAMRCAIHACEASIAEMRELTQPGMTENDVWAELHKSNIRRGGEWIETRILSTGQRTNPWFQECGPRILGNNEILLRHRPDRLLRHVYRYFAHLVRRRRPADAAAEGYAQAGARAHHDQRRYCQAGDDVPGIDGTGPSSARQVYPAALWLQVSRGRAVRRMARDQVSDRLGRARL
jgi:hypothetical protein